MNITNSLRETFLYALTVLKTSVMQNFGVLSDKYGILRICISGNCVQVCITKVCVCYL